MIYNENDRYMDDTDKHNTYEILDKISSILTFLATQHADNENDYILKETRELRDLVDEYLLK